MQQLTFSLMNSAEARAISAWRYEDPYSVYNIALDDPGSLAEMLDRRSPHYTVYDDSGRVVGFFSFGTSALVWDSSEPGLYVDGRTVPVGLGMRPELTGQGQGSACSLV